ncbi:MAG: radical SAM protein [Butyrivibrio sp.]|nr:radical SAM protein [Butyrivibrio sp.]
MTYMGEVMAYTRVCFDPWFFRNIHAGGMICPCCAMHDTDYGDYLIDSLDVEGAKIFHNSEVLRLKKGLLTGNLSPMCQTCALVPNQLISTDEYKKRLEKEFDKYSIDYKGKRYEEIECIKRVGVGITNRCNLRCIYCNQSVLADTNPYFKADFPKNKIIQCLKQLVESGVEIIETGAFGEATISKDWLEVYSKFHESNPNIELRLVTNLSKKYSDEEISFLAEHKVLNISIDTLNPTLFAQLRVNGNLELILNNLERIEKELDKKGYSHDRISISAVICNLTYDLISEIGNYAIDHGFNFAANNLEMRPNSLGSIRKEIFPVERLDQFQKAKLEDDLNDLKKKAEFAKVHFVSDVIKDHISKDFNQFVPADDNPILTAFYKKYPQGLADMFLATEYDMFQQQYSGIILKKNGGDLSLKLDKKYAYFVGRIVDIYREGHYSPKYGQSVLPGYRKIIDGGDVFECNYSAMDDNVEAQLLQIIDWKEA